MWLAKFQCSFFCEIVEWLRKLLNEISLHSNVTHFLFIKFKRYLKINFVNAICFQHVCNVLFILYNICDSINMRRFSEKIKHLMNFLIVLFEH